MNLIKTCFNYSRNRNVPKLHEEFKEIGNNLLSMHISYLDAMNDIAFKMRLQYEDVLLTSAIVLKPTLNQALSECISLRSAAMNDLIDNVVKGFNKRTKADIEECLRNILNKALRNEIPFKAGYDAQSFMSRVLSENWFGLSLNVEYDGDNLKICLQASVLCCIKTFARLQ